MIVSQCPACGRKHEHDKSHAGQLFVCGPKHTPLMEPTLNLCGRHYIVPESGGVGEQFNPLSEGVTAYHVAA